MNRNPNSDSRFDGWTVPPEMRHSPPRPVALSANGLAVAIVAILLAAVAIASTVALARVSRRQTVKYRAMQSEGRQTSARIVRLWQTKGENRRHFVEYRFETGGRTYWKEARVGSSAWKKMHDGDTVRVTFLPSNPEQSELYDRPSKPLPPWLPILVAMIGLGIAGVLACGLVRSRELLAEGRLAPGIVTSIKITKSEEGHIRTIHYEFQTLSGATRKGKTNSHNKTIVPGSLLTVIYDPNHAARNALYPLRLTKVRQDT